MNSLPWSRADIRHARAAPLAPILQRAGYRLTPLPNHNYALVPAHPNAPPLPGLVVKNNFWVWPERDLAGNAIDFFVKALGLSFHHAMRIITASQPYDPVGSKSLQTTGTARQYPENPAIAIRQEFRSQFGT